MLESKFCSFPAISILFRVGQMENKANSASWSWGWAWQYNAYNIMNRNIEQEYNTYETMHRIQYIE
jgi:hypothetical protein